MYAILGVLSLAPSTGYEIKKYSDQLRNIRRNEDLLTDLQRGLAGVRPERVRVHQSILRRAILTGEAAVAWCEETIDQLSAGDEWTTRKSAATPTQTLFFGVFPPLTSFASLPRLRGTRHRAGL